MKNNKISIPHHSAHSQARSQHYHQHVVNTVNTANKPSGVAGNQIVDSLNPTDTLPQASTVDTETQGPG